MAKKSMEQTQDTTETQLAASQDAGLATVGAAGRGFEAGVEQDDLIIPRAKLIQALSPEMTEGLPGVRVGSIINSLTKEVLPAEFIPVFSFKNYIRFNPRNKEDAAFDAAFEPGAIIWRSNDALDPRVDKECAFGPNGEKPLATEFMNFFAYFPGVAMPVIVSFSKTSYQAGRQLYSLCKFSGGDMFSRKYSLTGEMESNNIATFAVLKVRAAGMASPDEYKIGEQLWKEYSRKGKDITVHDESGDTVDAAPAATGRPY